VFMPNVRPESQAVLTRAHQNEFTAATATAKL
jgi:hypothetical protein